MRAHADAARVRAFMQRLSAQTRGPGRIHLVGGASAVLLGFRASTLDVDLSADPEPGRMFEAIAAIKDELDINVELAAPHDFIPELPNWRDRSVFIGRFGSLDFYHYDFASQLLAKVERDHEQDREDVASILAAGLVDREQAWGLFLAIEPLLIRYPAVDPAAFRARVAAALGR